MKRTILYSAFTVASFAVGFTAAAQTKAAPATRSEHYEGEPCDPSGASRVMSGYMVSTGRSGDEWECRAIAN